MLAVRPARVATDGGFAGLVVELGETTDALSLERRLARAVGDPRLRVLYQLAPGLPFVTASGWPAGVTPAGRLITVMSQSGPVVAALEHDRTSLEDPRLREAILAVGRLAVRRLIRARRRPGNPSISPSPAVGVGIRVVPTLSEAPAVTRSSDGHAPIVLTCPVPLPGDQAPEIGLLSDPALDELTGPSRSMLLRVIAAGPGQGTRELARRTGLAPASVSEHARILRQAALTGISPDGACKAHRLTPLGWALLLRSADPA
jgi:hypothetical protein